MCRGELADLLHEQSWGNKGRRYYYGRQETYENALKAALGIWYDVLATYHKLSAVSAWAKTMHAFIQAVSFMHETLTVASAGIGTS